MVHLWDSCQNASSAIQKGWVSLSTTRLEIITPLERVVGILRNISVRSSWLVPHTFFIRSHPGYSLVHKFT